MPRHKARPSAFKVFATSRHALAIRAISEESTFSNRMVVCQEGTVRQTDLEDRILNFAENSVNFTDLARLVEQFDRL